MIIIEIVIAIIIVLSVFRQPYLGIVFIAASIPVVELLPPIPLFTSVVSLIGTLTLILFLLQRIKESGKPLFRFGNIHILGLLFIGWIFISNPQAAWFGASRNWIFTFWQLWLLIWLAGELLDTPDKHLILMWVFSIASIASALVAISRGRIGADISSSLRVSGLADGQNEAARYFVVAMVFLNHIRIVIKKRYLRLLAIGGMMVTFLGVFFTVSRTGMLLLFVAICLMIFLQPGIKYRFQALFISIIAMLVLLFLSDTITSIVKSIIPSIIQGTDTLGLRYRLWQAGWRMWLDNPILGVGIGMAPTQLINYAQAGTVPQYYLNIGLATHNMYIQVLAETGLIGFVLFMLILIISLRNIWDAGKINDVNIHLLRNVWFAVFLVMLVGGITKSDHFDKLVWLTIGVSVFFRNQIDGSRQKTAVYKMSRGDQNRNEGIIGKNGSKI